MLRERTNDYVKGEIVVSPTAYRIRMANLDGRGNIRVTFKLWGTR